MLNIGSSSRSDKWPGLASRHRQLNQGAIELSGWAERDGAAANCIALRARSGAMSRRSAIRLGGFRVSQVFLAVRQGRQLALAREECQGAYLEALRDNGYS